MRPLQLVCALTSIPLLLQGAPALSAEADRSALLSGVTQISASGAPGPLCVFGPGAFALVAGREGKSASLPVAAAARWDRGRVVAFGHGGFLDAASGSDSSRMLANAVRWTAGAPASGGARIKVAVLRNRIAADALKMSGFEVESFDGTGLSVKVKDVRVLVADSHQLGAPADTAAVTEFVRAGGGLVTAGLGWGWQQLNPKKDLVTEHPGNQLLAPAGIVWAGGTIEKTEGEGYRVDLPADLALLNASTALDALIAHTTKATSLTPAELAQISATLASAMRSIPANDSLLLPRFAVVSKLPGAGDFPRPDKPLTADNPLARLVFTRDLLLISKAPPAMAHPHPAAAFFPGEVPTGAPRVSDCTVSIDAATPGWHSTGLYAAPGETIRIEVPPAAANAGLTVRIGCHSDALWSLDTWKRAPDISRTEKISGPTTAAANAFGGLIYVVVSDSSTLGTVALKISGAVEAPHFVLGKTSVADWRARIRQAPAPWAELETSKVILTVPSDNIRSLEDPDTLLHFWDQVLDAEADLAAIPHERKRPERIVADVQISAGYMHSGYPIMTHLDIADRAVSVEKLKAGGWGFWHELGHNHQQPEWTFAGTTEVTCNLFSLYVCETLCGQSAGSGHDAMEPAKVAKRMRNYLASGADFEQWKGDPFLALIMYQQLRAGFGWDTYNKVFAEYRALAKSDRPKSDAEKRDAWLVRFSRTTGRNLGPFFTVWGIPTSGAARAEVADLPLWMPTDFPAR